MKVLRSLMLVAAGAAALILVGCGTDNGMMSRESELVARTIPSTGESAYDPAASIHVKFNTGMDTSQFHERFFLLDASMHDDMHDSLGEGMMSDSTLAICDSIARGMMSDGMNQMMGAEGGRHGHMGRNGSGSGMMDQMMTMMGGGGHMSDTAAFYRGMHDRRQQGQFKWNAKLDSCVFTPNAPMISDRDYVVMIRSMGHAMNNGQLGTMLNEDNEDLMIRFHTR